MSKAIHLLIITAKNRLASKTFSVLNGLKSLGTGLKVLLGLQYFIFNQILKMRHNSPYIQDLLFGLPHMKVKPYERRLELEKLKYLMQDLIVDVSIFL